MPIERNTDQVYSHDTKMEPESEEGGETVEIPVSLLGGQEVAPGDVVRLEVVSSGDESGMVTVKYATEKEPEGIEDAASQFEG